MKSVTQSLKDPINVVRPCEEALHSINHLYPLELYTTHSHNATAHSTGVEAVGNNGVGE